MVKTRAVVFPRERSRQFHELRIIELFAQLHKQRVWNLHRSLRHAVGILQDELFRLGKEDAVAVVGQRCDFFRRGAVGSADRRTNVNSKRAADERGDAQLRQVLEGRVHQVAGEKRLFHLAVAPEKFAVMRDDLHGRHNSGCEDTATQVGGP